MLLIKREQLPWRRFMSNLRCSSVIPIETSAVREICSCVVHIKLLTALKKYSLDRIYSQHGEEVSTRLPDSSSILSVVRGASGAYMASTNFAMLVASSDTVSAVTSCPKSMIMFL